MIKSGDTFTLKDGETFKIKDLPDNLKYTITQDSYKNDGYTTTPVGYLMRSHGGCRSRSGALPMIGPSTS